MENKDIDPVDPDDAWYDTQAHFDRYRRYGVRPKTLKSVVNRVMARKGYGQQQTSNQVQDAWLQIVPQGLGAMTRVAQVRRGVLEVYVSNSMVLQQLEFQKRELLKQLQNQLTETAIRGLRFKLGNHGG